MQVCFWLFLSKYKKDTCFQAASFAPGLARALVAAVNFKNQMRHEQKRVKHIKKETIMRR